MSQHKLQVDELDGMVSRWSIEQLMLLKIKSVCWNVAHNEDKGQCISSWWQTEAGAQWCSHQMACYNYEQWRPRNNMDFSFRLPPHTAGQKCGLKCSATFALVKHVSSAQMEEPPRMIPGLHNAVSCPRSAKCGWLSHPWLKCRYKGDEFFMQLKYICISHCLLFAWIDFFRRLVKSEGCNGSFWPEKGPTSVWPPPHMSVISYTLPSTKINVQIWKPPNAIYFWWSTHNENQN